VAKYYILPKLTPLVHHNTTASTMVLGHSKSPTPTQTTDPSTTFYMPLQNRAPHVSCCWILFEDFW